MKTLRIHRYFPLFVLTMVFSLFATGQEVEKETKKKSRFEPDAAFLIVPSYTAQIPLGDMGKRFGFNSLFGAHIAYKTKTNWLVGLEGGFIFGTTVKEAFVLSNIATSTGQFITQNNAVTNVNPQEQGFIAKFTAGKVIPFSEKYPDAGLLLMTGIGFLYHKIAIPVKESDLPQLSNVYRQGYDRMSNGPVISQFVGGIFLKRKKFINLYGGVQFDIGFTQGRRAFDFYLMKPLQDNRLDMFLGFKLGWIIPVFPQTSEKELYYY